MKLRGIIASALAFALSVSLAFAQVNQGTSPLTPTKGGTNSAFVGFTGPASSIKTFTLPNASDTIATLAAIQTFTAAKTFNNATLLLAGSSSGTTTLVASAAASGTLTLPAATDTLVGRATTDTLTNKTLTSPTLTTPALGVATATSINKVAITAPATSATLTIPDGVTLTGPASSGTSMTLGNTETVTGVKTFGSSGAVGRLKIAGTTSGSTVLDATAVASGTLTLPAATDTLVGKATTDTLTNKTISGGSNTLSSIANSSLSNMAAYTVKGNSTGSSAAPTDISIPALTQKASPVATDKIMIADSAASDALKYATVSSIASAGSVGSFNGRTGTVVPAAGDYTYSGNTIALPRSYLSGFGLSNDVTSPNTVIDVAAGTCRDSTNAFNITISSGYTKTTGSWVVGTGNGGLDTGSVAANTSYFPFAILRTDTGVTDVLLSASPTAPTLPASYGYFCRLGAIKTASASTNILAFSQLGNLFYWGTDDGGASATFNSTTNATPATATTITAKVPTGIKVEAILRAQMTATGALTNCLLSSFDQTDQSPSASVNFSADSTNHSTLEVRIRTNTSGQFRARCGNASVAMYITAAGWVDSTLGF